MILKEWEIGCRGNERGRDKNRKGYETFKCKYNDREFKLAKGG